MSLSVVQDPNLRTHVLQNLLSFCKHKDVLLNQLLIRLEVMSLDFFCNGLCTGGTGVIVLIELIVCLKSFSLRLKLCNHLVYFTGFLLRFLLVKSITKFHNVVSVTLNSLNQDPFRFDLFANLFEFILKFLSVSSLLRLDFFDLFIDYFKFEIYIT